ncbi:MAG: ASCH domain-containing protein [Pseudomonadota bacterium]
MVTLDEAKRRYPNAATFRFGDSEAICRELLDLVRAGAKRATCEALSVYESGHDTMPEVGRRDIALDWSGRPALVIETTSIETVAFNQVSEAFALAEGENDSLAGWRRVHQDYFARSVGFSPDMLVVCERFDVVEVFDRSGSEF